MFITPYFNKISAPARSLQHAFFRRTLLLDRYLVKSFFLFQIASLGALFVVFLINNILVFAQVLLGKNVGSSAVLSLIFFTIPSSLTWAMPFSTLFGSILTVNRLAAGGEFQAMRAMGVGYARLFLPFAVFSGFLIVVSFILMNLVEPPSLRAFKRAYERMLAANPRIMLESGAIRRMGGTTFAVGSLEGSSIEGIVIIDGDDEGSRRIIVAPLAGIVTDGDHENIFGIKMLNVQMISADRDTRLLDYSRSSAGELHYNMTTNESGIGSDQNDSDATPIWGLAASLKSEKKALADRQIANELKTHSLLGTIADDYALALNNKASHLGDSYRQFLLDKRKSIVEDYTFRMLFTKFFRKISFPLLCFVFTLFGFSIALHGGKNVKAGAAMVFGIVFAVGYWIFLFIAMAMVLKSYTPIAFMISPDVVFFIGGAILFAIKVR